MVEYAVYRIDREKDFPTLDERISRLPAWRRRDALSYPRPSDRLQSAVACELLGELLLKYCGIPADRFRIEYDLYGKPSVAGRDDVYISLAHCRLGVVAAVADVPVGCDIEEIARPYRDNGAVVADYCFTGGERRAIMAADDPALEFTKIWTVKESLFKLDNSLDIENIDTAHLPGLRVVSAISTDYVATVISAPD